MKSWTSPDVPALPALPENLQLHDTSTGALVPVESDDGVGSIYVCGITPYDATHLGHANTYVQFDLLVRYWRAAGLQVNYVQNVTDIDDPLLERATATGVDWFDLAQQQTELFREDMSALGVIAPDAYLGAVETIPVVAQDVERLVELGMAYPVPVPVQELAEGVQPGAAEAFDIYFDTAQAEASTPWTLGSIGNYDRAQMEELFPQRGGDPQRPHKRDPLDPLLWRARRDGEPHWDGRSLGEGRPGWHIECSVIARRHLPAPFMVQGGGSDLRFPHHEFSAAHATAADGVALASTYMHTGMVGLDGEKMSKSKGNLVLSSRLRAEGIDPQVIRTLLLSHHYREDWSYAPDQLRTAAQRWTRWNQALASAPETDRFGELGTDSAVADDLQYALHSALSQNLNAPAALETLDMWADGQLAADSSRERVAAVVKALLGIELLAAEPAHSMAASGVEALG
ncbi:cysteine--1-D-myo-inosityl 2-amino-2-deoxy-alpha-D-glucopyranoside ligase [Nesterenkonia halotolerans]|uniref:L-cysteine:1D-myo-inositol 2-amino-2-deoxy-alpha-D-glucopyranoside ligase n=1 Tax=Nesterenkonia halotolerans TaxID=225325 RepID=A0ABR9J4M7_9MICC|nr:cysteine--1-D-myo-inosityl 2-amino-2-deoxy-alpha-D-glucopyranoside ligase [Nesterenkonia halotolerans]MBE1513824.1 L-cysteine:1D-myo-inositol 2-amino-2-deoxy-alpha-D-glucopyranoside ligase [Nesterenkonia halotolerans]